MSKWEDKSPEEQQSALRDQLEQVSSLLNVPDIRLIRSEAQVEVIPCSALKNENLSE